MILPSGLSTHDYSRLASAKGWGAGWPSCSGMAGRLEQIVGPVSGVAIQGGVRSEIQPLVRALVSITEQRGYLLRPGWNWGAGCRAIAGTSTPSNHSWGLAVDLNAPANPYTSSGQHDIPDWVYELWAKYGFGLGADYLGKQDWMHFEFMGTPLDAVLMTKLVVPELVVVLPPAPQPKPPIEELADMALICRRAQEQDIEGRWVDYAWDDALRVFLRIPTQQYYENLRYAGVIEPKHGEAKTENWDLVSWIRGQVAAAGGRVYEPNEG